MVAYKNGARGILIMNNMGSSNSVVRMDMKSLISYDIKLAAASYTYASTQTLLAEYNKVRRDENPLYMTIQDSDNKSGPDLEIWLIVTIVLVVIAFVLGIILGYCFCCKRDSRYQCVCCCACCECRWCCKTRQTTNESVTADEAPSDQIDEV